jgi:hypothetical protein
VPSRREFALARKGLRGDLVERVGVGREPTFDVVRPADLVSIQFSFQNLEVSGAGSKRVLKRQDAGRPGYLVATFPPQHIAERAFFESAPGADSITLANQPEPTKPPTTDEPPLLPPVRTLLAGPSRLVFFVRDEVIPFSPEGLLQALSTLELRVGRNAAPAVKKRPRWLDEVLRTPGLFGAKGSDVTAARIQSLAAFKATSAEMVRRHGEQIAALASSQLDIAAGVHALRPSILDQILRPGPVVLPVRPEDPFRRGYTGLELPFRLIVSPHAGAGWAQRPDSPEQDGRVELWHTRLGVRARDEQGQPVVHEEDMDGRTIRAVWTRDFEWWDEAQRGLPNFDGSQDEPPTPGMRMALSAYDRISIVHQTADWGLRKRRRPWVPEAVSAERLMLSSLGGWLTSRVMWETRPDGFSLEEWKHRAAMGRDHVVTVVYAGFLYPYGHRASLIKVTERKVDRGKDGRPPRPGNPAYLFQRMFILVREPTRIYRDSPDETLNRALPLTSLTFTTRVTPPLDLPTKLGDVPSTGPVFLPMVGGFPFAFKATAIDVVGNMVEFAVPAVFVAEADNGVNAVIDALSVPERTFSATMGGQRLAYAPSATRDDTTLDTSGLVFTGVTAGFLKSRPQEQPRFLPVLKEARVTVPVARSLTGTATPVRIGLAEKYIDGGLGDGNPGEVFAKVLDATSLDFSRQGDRSGGLVQPSFSLSGLSRLTGPIGGDLDQFALGKFTPDDFFKGVLNQAKLFGAIELSDIISEVPQLEQQLEKVPRFFTQVLGTAGAFLQDLERMSAAVQAMGGQAVADALTARTKAEQLLQQVAGLQESAQGVSIGDVEQSAKAIRDALPGVIASIPQSPLPLGVQRELTGVLTRLQGTLADATLLAQLMKQIADFAQGLKIPEVVQTRLSWEPDIQPWPAGSGAIFKPNRAPKGLSVAVDLVAPTTGDKPPSVDVACVLEDFELRLIGSTTFLALKFDKIEFRASAGKKPDVDVVFGDITFEGVLAFVETLRTLIPLDGFSDPPSLDISEKGIEAGFSLALPNLAIGVFSLENISLGAGLKIPFIGESLEFRFSFCTREDPFRLTVALFGGGGFFGITITPAKVRMLEAALEFGAAISLDFGVASGSLSAMGGIYFKLELGDATLTGYFRLRGEVDVLGLISASIELYLALSYEFASGKAVGKATLTIEVEVAFFSTSVEVSCERKFAGANKDPSFAAIMAPGGDRTPWRRYCQAFEGV